MKVLLTGIILLGLAAGSDVSLKVGDPAPDFELTDQDSVIQRLSDYEGQKVAVYFYPKDDTPGCTKEACSIRDNFSTFEKAGIQVFGISYDSPESHKKFADKYQLPFSLLSDTDKSTAKAYGSDGFFTPKRKTFLIDEQGILFKIYNDVDVTTHGAQILEDFKTQKDSGTDPNK